MLDKNQKCDLIHDFIDNYYKGNYKTLEKEISEFTKSLDKEFKEALESSKESFSHLDDKNYIGNKNII